MLNPIESEELSFSLVKSEAFPCPESFVLGDVAGAGEDASFGVEERSGVFKVGTDGGPWTIAVLPLEDVSPFEEVEKLVGGAAGGVLIETGVFSWGPADITAPLGSLKRQLNYYSINN